MTRGTVQRGIVRYIRTDCPEDDYYSLENASLPGHFLSGDLQIPEWFLEDCKDKLVEVVVIQEGRDLFSLKIRRINNK